MGRTSNRYQRFLKEYEFYPNSIEFRISSSKALEKFKNVQSFQLNQLINGRFYFSQDKREILLLMYDMWFRWLVEIENLCIELSGGRETNIVSAEDVALVRSLAQKTIDKYTHVITKENAEHFDPKITSIYLEHHKTVEQFLMHSIEKSAGANFIQMFNILVDDMCLIMQYMLIEIHELGSVIASVEKCEEPFIILNEFNSETMKTLGVCLANTRIESYKKHFGVEKIYIKNYSDAPLDQELLTMIESTGVEIDYRKSILN